MSMPGIPDVPVQVQVDPNEDTEWNDILRQHKIIPEKPPSPSAGLEEALVETHRLIYEHRLDGKDLDELDALEEDEDADFLAHYRNKRLAELNEIAAHASYGQVYPLQKPDYAQDVTEESKKAYVFVLLTSSAGANVQSRLLESHWRALASRFADIKFAQIRADLCIEDYPDRKTPTMLIYRNGDIKRQIITLRELAGERTTVRDLEGILVTVGAVKLGDSRLSREEGENGENGAPLIGKHIRQGPSKSYESDSDWD